MYTFSHRPTYSSTPCPHPTRISLSASPPSKILLRAPPRQASVSPSAILPKLQYSSDNATAPARLARRLVLMGKISAWGLESGGRHRARVSRRQMAGESAEREVCEGGRFCRWAGSLIDCVRCCSGFWTLESRFGDLLGRLV